MSSEPVRNILRSTSIIGAASMINIVIGLVRVKLAAVILGPAGMGLVGLLNNLMATAASVSALGLGTVGTRQVAEAGARGDEATVGTARRALFWGTFVLASVGAGIFWLLRQPIADRVVGRTDAAGDVGLLAVGVALIVVAGSQSALLNGLRRIGDLARVMVWSSLLGTAAASAALLAWGERALLPYLLLPPAFAAAVGLVFTLRLPRASAPPRRWRQLGPQWAVMARLGAAFMLAGLAMTAGQLAVRTLVRNELGPHALGLFECAWLISMTYIGFVLNAMGTDYYPRLTAVVHDKRAANALVNQQTEVALLLAGPVLLAALAVAPWLIELLYARSFVEAAAILRWQIVGDLLKVVSWPLGYVILAAGRGRMFMFCEASVVATFVVVSWATMGVVGIQATGVGFVAMYLVLLPLNYAWVRAHTGFRWTHEVVRRFVVLFVAAVALALLGALDARLGAVVGLPLVALFAARSVASLRTMSRDAGSGVAQSRWWMRLAALSRRWRRPKGGDER